MKLINLAKLLFLFGVLFSIAPFARGQVSTGTKNAVSKQPQWEYLVISFGKVYFSDPLSDSDAKSSGDSKLISFSKEGIVIANEGIPTQKSMDTLGKFGWELVSTVGAIGGDQEMLFKRPYDENRSKQEEELIKKEGERLRTIVQQERAKTTAVSASTTELVDLDEGERTEARNANRRSQEDRLRKAAESVKDYPISLDSVISDAYSPKDTNVSISVTADGTNSLLTDGNKYRSNEAKKLGDSVAAAIARAAGVTVRQSYGADNSIAYIIGKVKISVDVIINFNGKKKVVATSKTGGDW
jgi:hypothetical protein